MTAAVPASVVAGTPFALTLSLSAGLPEHNASVLVSLPGGVSLVPGSATLAEASIPDPDVSSLDAEASRLRFSGLGDLQPGAAATPLSAQLVIGSKVGAGSPLAFPVALLASPQAAGLPHATSAGLPAPGTDGASAVAATSVAALTVTATDSAAGQVVRGAAHRVVEVTVTVQNGPDALHAATVDTWIPAGLEVLGCGTGDHSPAGVTEFSGAPRIQAVSPPDDCAEPTRVVTAVSPGHDSNGGALPDGVYTHATWAVGDVAAGDTATVIYYITAPLHANAAGSAGAADLSNNTGPEVADGAVATTTIDAAASAGGRRITATGTHSAAIVDLGAVASVAPARYVPGTIAEYTIDLAASQYRSLDGAALTIHLPAGECPLDARGNHDPGADSACAALSAKDTLHQPSTVWDTRTVRPDGGADLVWQLGARQADTTARITFYVVDLANRTGDHPIAHGNGDTLTATAEATAVAHVICAAGVTCGSGGTPVVTGATTAQLTRTASTSQHIPYAQPPATADASQVTTTGTTSVTSTTSAATPATTSTSTSTTSGAASTTSPTSPAAGAMPSAGSAHPALALTSAQDGTLIAGGQTIHYVARVANPVNGASAPLSGATVVLRLPRGITSVRATSDGGLDNGAGTVTWTGIPSVAPGQSLDLTADVATDPLLPEDTTLVATAHLLSAAGAVAADDPLQTDPPSFTNVASTSSGVIGAPLGGTVTITLTKGIGPVDDLLLALSGGGNILPGPSASFTCSQVPAPTAGPPVVLNDCPAASGTPSALTSPPNPNTQGFTLGSYNPADADVTLTVTYSATFANDTATNTPGHTAPIRAFVFDTKNAPTAPDPPTAYPTAVGPAPQVDTTIYTDTGNPAAGAAATYTVTAPSVAMNVTTTPPGGKVGAGDTFVAHVTAASSGAPAYTFSSTITAPTGTTIISTDGGAAVSPASGTAVTWSLGGPLPASSVLNVTVQVNTSGTLPTNGTTLTVGASAPTYHGVSSGTYNPAIHATYIGSGDTGGGPKFSVPALMTSVTGQQPYAQPGQTYNWKIVVANAGGNAAAQLSTVTSSLPPNWAYGPGNATITAPYPTGNIPPAPSTQAPSATITDSVSIPGGDEVDIIMPTHPTAGVTAAQLGGAPATPNTFSATAHFDDGHGNNAGTAQGSDSTTIPAADLSIAKTNPGPIALGDPTATYSIVVTNNGPSTAGGYTMTDSIAATFAVKNVAVSGGGTVSCTPGPYPQAPVTPTVITCTDSSAFGAGLANGATATITITVEALLSSGATVDNTASLSGQAVYDPASGNDTASDNAVPVATASVSGRVVEDTNDNGVSNPGEVGIPGVTVSLSGTTSAFGVINQPVGPFTVVTAGNDAAGGHFTFTGLPPGSYTLSRSALPGPYLEGRTMSGTVTPLSGSPVSSGTPGPPSTIASITITPGASGVFDFPGLRPSTLGGRAWDDTADDNGVFEGGEPGISTTITLTGNDDTGAAVNLSTPTAGDGSFSFAGLRPADVSGYTITRPLVGGRIEGLDHIDTAGGASGSPGVVTGVAPVEGNAYTDYRLPVITPASLAGHYYVDAADSGAYLNTDTVPGGGTITSIHLGGTDDRNNPVDMLVATDGTGLFQFQSLRPAKPSTTYTISLTDTSQINNFLAGRNLAVGTLGGTRGGTKGSTISAIPVVSGNNGTGYDFGFVVPSTVGGVVFLDNFNNNGLKDNAAETGINNITVHVDLTDDLGATSTLTTTTAANGTFSFTQLRPGPSYKITVAAVPNVLLGTDLRDPLIAATPLIEDAIAGDSMGPFALAGGLGHTIVNNTFAKLTPSTISGTVFVDANDNGVMDGAEQGVDPLTHQATVTITGVQDNGQPPTAAPVTTGANGAYTINNLRPGTYVVTVTPATPHIVGFTSVGTLADSTTSVILPAPSSPGVRNAPATTATGAVTAITFPTRGNVTGANYNLGVLNPASLAGLAYLDTNENGVQDPGENGVPNIAIHLTGTDDQGKPVDQTTATAPDGTFSFPGLRPCLTTPPPVLPATCTTAYALTETSNGGLRAGQDAAGTTGGTVNPGDQITGVNIHQGDAGTGYLFGKFPAQADLSVTLSHTGNGTAGQVLAEAIQVTNFGPSLAAGPVAVTTQLPAGVSFQNAAGGGWTCSASGGTLTCTLGANLPPGSAPPLTANLQLGSGLLGSTIALTATVASPTGDPVPGNNTGTDSIQVSTALDAAITNALSAPIPTSGGAATYVLTVTNNGPSDAPAGLVVNDNLPFGVNPTSATGNGWNCTVNGGTVTCTSTAVIPSGASSQVTITTTVTDPNGTEVDNTATLSSFQNDGVTTDKQATAVGVVGGAAGAAIGGPNTGAEVRWGLASLLGGLGLLNVGLAGLRRRRVRA